MSARSSSDELLLRYAPRRTRQSPPVVPALDVLDEPRALAYVPTPPMTPPMAPGIGGPNLDLPLPSLRPFEGDVAIKDLRRRLALDPDLVPQPPIRAERGRGEQWLGRLSLMLILAAMAGFGIVSLTVSRDARQHAGIAGAAPPQSVVTGAAPPLRERSAISDEVVAHAPRDFVGAMDATVDLRSARDRLVDSQMVRLEWVPTQEAPPAPSPAAARPQVQSLDVEELATLMKRAEDFLKIGDIASARLVLARAAAAGDARAALTLGGTFDPVFLAGKGVLGLAPDLVQARAWYQRAVELGSTEASQSLLRLADGGAR